jgi:hypothetical protein
MVRKPSDHFSRTENGVAHHRDGFLPKETI